MVYGSAAWHAENDPKTGYCSCVDELIACALKKVASEAVPAQVDHVKSLSALLIDEAIDIVKSYASAPRQVPRDLFAAALALSEEVQRLRSAQPA